MNENSLFRILVVDDIPENLQVVASTLAPEGYQMRFAESGESALEAIAGESIDLILLDVMMPGMDGFEVCGRLKSNPDTFEIPVIFITAKADVDSVVKGFQMGGVDYVTKPFQVEELRVRVRNHLQLRSRELELERLDRARIQFMSVFSHDLKIPINGISSYLSVMNIEFEQMSIAELRENLGLLSRAADRFSGMIQNLMSYSSIQSGLATFRPDVFELEPVLQDIVKMFEIEGNAQEIKWIIEIPAEASVLADLEMTQCIFRNLLSNAIKYSHAGGEIRIFARPDADNTDMLIEVRDHGVGISEDCQENLFELSRDIKEIGVNGAINSTMGLLLAKECVERHGGRIWIESVLNEGTKVSFTLPKM